MIVLAWCLFAPILMWEVGMIVFLLRSVVLSFVRTSPIPKLVPEVKWKWLKWTAGFWCDPEKNTALGFDLGPLEIIWRYE